jgi:DNA-directed RNA polymerase specialized sigma24 family protein
MTFTDAITIEPADLSECPDLVQGLPVRERLQQALRQGHRTAKELAVETGVPLAQVKARLSEGSKTWCISLNRELWGLRDR